MKPLYKGLLAACLLPLLLATACRKSIAIDPPKNELTTETVFSDSATTLAALANLYVPFTRHGGAFVPACPAAAGSPPSSVRVPVVASRSGAVRLWILGLTRQVVAMFWHVVMQQRPPASPSEDVVAGVTPGSASEAGAAAD